MTDHFGDSVESALLRSLEESKVRLLFGPKEKQVLRLFYDPRYKVRREKVPRFLLYALLCDGKQDDVWPRIMSDVNTALKNLEDLGLIEKIEPSIVHLSSQMHVGPALAHYTVTADGLETLQNWHPALRLRLRAWIAVMPPWLVLVGSIAGAIGAFWKIIELVMKLT